MDTHRSVDETIPRVYSQKMTASDHGGRSTLTVRICKCRRSCDMSARDSRRPVNVIMKP